MGHRVRGNRELLYPMLDGRASSLSMEEAKVEQARPRDRDRSLMPDSDADVDEIASISLQLYKSLKFIPPAGQYTILASFVLSKPGFPPQLKVISLATGTKCLPASNLPILGDALHDSHAEVLARRGAIRWFIQELSQVPSDGSSTISFSEWLCKRESGLYGLRDDVRVHMYVSTVPCKSSSSKTLSY